MNCVYRWAGVRYVKQIVSDEINKQTNKRREGNSGKRQRYACEFYTHVPFAQVQLNRKIKWPCVNLILDD